MDRRQFLTSSGVGAAAVAAGGLAGGAGMNRWDGVRESAQREGQDYAGNGHGDQRVWWSVEATELVAALTFDDGPHAELTPRVLAMLADRGVAATFFMIGRHVELHPDLVRRVVAAGHDVGNHTWSHRRVVSEDDRAVRDEVSRGSRALERVTGRRPRWFRPPRGMVTGVTLEAAADAGEQLVLWSTTRGGPEIDGSAAVLHHLSADLRPGAIIDLHDGTGINQHDPMLLRRREEELAVLPAFLDRAKARGYRFLTVSDLLAGTWRTPAARR